MNMGMAYRITLSIAGLGIDPDGEQIERLLDTLQEEAPEAGAVVTTNSLVDSVDFTLAVESSDVLRAGEAVAYIVGRAAALLGLPDGRPIGIEGEEVGADEAEDSPREPAIA
jgi:hypothetical protein